MDGPRRAESILSLDAARLERAVRAACAVAFADARRARPGERFYAFGVWAGPDLELAAVSSTEEALRGAPPGARWRPRQWPRFEAGAEHFAAAQVLLERADASPATRARTLEACARALRALDEDGHFGAGSERARVVVSVFTAGATPEETVAVARGLNPPEAVARLVRELGAPPRVFGADARAYAVDALAVGPDQLAALVDGVALAWRWSDASELRRLAVPAAWAMALADDLMVVGDGRRGGLHRVRLDDPTPAPPLDGPASGVAALALTEDGRALFVAGRAEELWRIDVARGAVRCARRARARALAMSPSGDQVALATGVRALLVDAGSLDSRRALGRRSDRLRAVAFSPDARSLVAGGRALGAPGDDLDRRGVVAVFDAATGRERWRLATGGEVTCVACSPDGLLVAAGDARGEARVWELDGGAEVARLQGPQQVLSSVAFAAGGEGRDAVLLTAGRDVDRGPAVHAWPLAPTGRRTRARSRKLRS